MCQRRGARELPLPLLHAIQRDRIASQHQQAAISGGDDVEHHLRLGPQRRSPENECGRRSLDWRQQGHLHHHDIPRIVMADLRDPQVARGVFRERDASLLHRLLGDSQAHAAAAKLRFQRALHFRRARLRQRGNVLDRQRQSGARLRPGNDLFGQLARGRVPLLGSGGSRRNQCNKDCQRKEEEHTLAAGGHPKAQISWESRIIAFHSHGSSTPSTIYLMTSMFSLLRSPGLLCQY